MDMEAQLLQYQSLFYHFYFGCSLISQSLLLFLMIKNRSGSLKDMRMYLLNTLIIQFFSTIGAYVVQCRMVPSIETMGFLCYGPCMYFGVLSCEVLFHIFQNLLIASATSLIIAFYHRYEILTTNNFTRTKHYRLLIFSYCVPLMSSICGALVPKDLQKIKDELKILHPLYDLEKYAVLGFSEAKKGIAIFNTIVMTFEVYGTPFVALMFRWKILKILNTSKTFNAEKIEQSRSMIKGLTIQTLLPLICYCPSFTYYIYAQYTQSDNQIIEFVSGPITLVYTVFDPLLTIYFVLPYRRSLKQMFSRQNSVSNAITSQSDSNTRRNDILRV